MNQKVEVIINTFKIDSYLLNNSIKDVQEEDINKRPNDCGNSLLFIAGHVTQYYFSILKLLGIEKEFPWGDTFARGVNVDNNTEYPKIEEIVELYNKISKESLAALEQASDETLSAKVPFELPGSDGTVLGAMGFFAFHETYHIGQMAYVRRLLGYSQLVG